VGDFCAKLRDAPAECRVDLRANYSRRSGVRLLVEIALEKWLMSGSICGLILGLICGLEQGLITALNAGLIAAPIFGLICGLGAGSLNHITAAETISWKWNQFWRRTVLGSIVGSFVGFIVGLCFGLIHGLNEMLALKFGLHAGLIYGLIFGLVIGLVGGFTNRVKVSKASPNQGIKLSPQNSLATVPITFLTSG
jgi:hypothetical protein